MHHALHHSTPHHTIQSHFPPITRSTHNPQILASTACLSCLAHPTCSRSTTGSFERAIQPSIQVSSKFSTYCMQAKASSSIPQFGPPGCRNSPRLVLYL